jgi:hypothetical protein
MLEQLMNLVKESAQDSVVKNPEVPDQHNEGIIQEAVKSIMSGLQKELAGGTGGVQNVIKTLSGKESTTPEENPVVNNISGDFINNIMQKFGISSSTAKGIAASLIPMIMGKLVHKTNDPNDSSLNLEGILGSLTGGKASALNLGGILQSFTGGGTDDQADVEGAAGAVSNAAKEERASSGDGILGSIKGLFGGK